MMRHKPDLALRGKFHLHPDYQDMHRAKVDMNMHNVDPHQLGDREQGLLVSFFTIKATLMMRDGQRMPTDVHYRPKV
jgi:hypothetical protein